MIQPVRKNRASKPRPAPLGVALPPLRHRANLLRLASHAAPT
ncbi:MAG TPA: hypothetical protein VG710_14710 [Opitutus sp.]|nr:hypothetical protein [Opitutus sp.]